MSQVRLLGAPLIHGPDRLNESEDSRVTRGRTSGQPAWNWVTAGKTALGALPEWLKGTGCKPVVSAAVVRIHHAPRKQTPCKPKNEKQNSKPAENARSHAPSDGCRSTGTRIGFSGELASSKRWHGTRPTRNCSRRCRLRRSKKARFSGFLGRFGGFSGYEFCKL